MRTWIVALGVGCGSREAVKLPGAMRPPADVLVEGEATGCPDGWRWFADRREPARFSFCAPHGARVEWASRPEEVSGTDDYVSYPVDDSASFGVWVSARMPEAGLAPDASPNDTVVDFDRADDRIAGHTARHYRYHLHVHHERSYVLDQNHNHPASDETWDHDQFVEVWALPFGAGKLEVILRTQENTPRTTSDLLHHVAESVKL
jgi:hypothetical protein